MLKEETMLTTKRERVTLKAGDRILFNIEKGYVNVFRPSLSSSLGFEVFPFNTKLPFRATEGQINEWLTLIGYLFELNFQKLEKNTKKISVEAIPNEGAPHLHWLK